MAISTSTAAARHRGPVAHATVRLGRPTLTIMLWFWVVVTPFVVAGTIVLARLTGPLEPAVVMYVRQGVIWFPFAQAIGLVGTFFTMHVASGMTRRTFARASTLAVVGVGAGYALVLAALAAVEHQVHTALGWGWRITDAMLADASSPAGMLAVELVLEVVAAMVSGLLVGAVYQRGGWWGTLSLPLTVAPVLVVPALLGGWFVGGFDSRATWDHAGLPVAASLLLIVAAAAAYAAVVHRIPVRPRTG